MTREIIIRFAALFSSIGFVAFAIWKKPDLALYITIICIPIGAILFIISAFFKSEKTEKKTQENKEKYLDN